MTDTHVEVVSGEKILVQIGDGQDPEVFAHDCMINAERGINLTASTRVLTVPNCTDPSKPDKTTRVVDATDSTISGAGKLHSGSTLEWMQRRGKTINIRVRQAGVWRVAGAYILSAFNITGAARDYATASITLEQADEPTIAADVA